LQNFQLLLHIPDLANFDGQISASWQLFDRQSSLLREGTGRLSAAGEVPRTGHTVIVIPARRIVCIETRLPLVSAQKRDALLRYAIEDKLTIDPATVHAVVIGASASNPPNTHIIAAIDRSWLTSVLAWLAEAGIEPAQAVSAAALIPVASNEWSVVLSGAHGLARRADGFAYSFDVEQSGIQTTGIPMEPPFSLVLALKEARENAVSPSQLAVITDQAANAPWVDAWQRRLDCPVVIKASSAPQMVTSAAGNLLSGDFAPRSASSGWMRLFRPAIVVAALIAILHLGFTVIDAWRLDQHRRVLENEMVQVFKDAFPKAQTIVDPALQMRRNLDALKRDAGMGSSDDARALLAQLTAILKTVPDLMPQSIAIRDGSVGIEALVVDSQQQQVLRSRSSETRGAMFSVDAQNMVHLTMKAEH
jgi:type II secretion system protein L